MQADPQEQDQVQVLSRLIAIDNFDHKVITASFQGANSPEHVCPICHEQFEIGKANSNARNYCYQIAMYRSTYISLCLLTSMPCQ